MLKTALAKRKQLWFLQGEINNTTSGLRKVSCYDNPKKTKPPRFSARGPNTAALPVVACYSEFSTQSVANNFRVSTPEPEIFQTFPASCCQVPMTESGFKEIELMPSFINHSAKSG